MEDLSGIELYFRRWCLTRHDGELIVRSPFLSITGAILSVNVLGFGLLGVHYLGTHSFLYWIPKVGVMKHWKPL